MSRIRIVGGTIAKHTVGKHNMYAEENIVFHSDKIVSEKGEEKGVTYGEPQTYKANFDFFDISFSLNKIESTFVPMGILDFENNYENRFFVFDYSLKFSNLDSLNFQIFNDKGEEIYQVNHLAPIVVEAKRAPQLFSKIKEETPVFDPLNPVKSYDIHKMFSDYLYPDLTHRGNYNIYWDGFDKNEIYDSSLFDGKKFKAKITASKGGTSKIQEIEFETSRKEVDWVDVKIDKNTKKIDVTLRVDLKDGGAEGLECITAISGMRDNARWETKCPWDKIPASKINANQPIIKQRTRSFIDLEKLTLDGINYHWGRNNNHTVAKNVIINNVAFEVYMNAINTPTKTMDDLSLVYNTNGDWMRSGNPGTATANPISWIGNLVSREAICYNTGYIEYSNGWGYQTDIEEDVEFKETSAHEIGHEILKSYGGTGYSYGHKGSVNVVTQNKNKNSTNYPLTGEIDIMPYYQNYIPISERKRMIAAEKDVLSLIWLTKFKIK